MTPLIGFAPDADQTTPGLLSDCENLIPALVGMEGAPDPLIPGSVPPLPAACRGAAVVYRSDNQRRLLAATTSDIYQLGDTGWVSQGRVGGYTGSPDTRWSFAQFGDATLMAFEGAKVQRSLDGVFSDIASAPNASIIFSVGSFVMALNTSVAQDQWHCCASFNDTDWTPSLTTQAASGRLVTAPGRLTAGARLGEYAVAYKERAIFLGQHVGTPSIWDWTQIPSGEAGCVGKQALCDLDGVHFFVGPDNFWLFDGTRPVPIGDGSVRRWFVENANHDFLYKTTCIYDRDKNRVWVFYPSAGSTECDSAIVYHTQTKQWGRANRSIQAALLHVAPAVSYDTWNMLGATYDDLSLIGFDTPLLLAGFRVVSIFDETGQLRTYTGASASSSLTTGEVGDDEDVSRLKQIRLRYAVAPTSATAQIMHAANSGEAFTPGVSGAMNDGKFDLLQCARWHKATIAFTGPVRVTHITAKFKPAGRR